MTFEINISKRNNDGMYIHYFATAKRSIPHREKLTLLVEDFMIKYPSPTYKVDVSYEPEIGRSMNAADYLENPDKLTEEL